MKPRQRRLINGLADKCEALAEWLGAKAERKPRVRPLRFPTEFELTMQRITDEAMRRHAEDILFTSGKIWADIPYRAAIHEDFAPNFIKINVPAEYE